jgi:hypothetical protein
LRVELPFENPNNRGTPPLKTKLNGGTPPFEKSLDPPLQRILVYIINML